jgi:hypothetical protein
MGTVPVAPSAKPPIGKTMPIVLALTGAIVLIGVSTAYNVMTGSGHKQDAAKSALPSRPSTADTQQVSGFEKQQALIQKSDAEHARLQQAIAAMQAQDQGMQAQEQAMGQRQGQPVPLPEADGTAPMTPAQSAAIYGTGPNAPRQTSGQSEAHAQAKQKAADREKHRVDALNSDTVAVDFQMHDAKPEGQAPSSTAPTVVANQIIGGESPAAPEEGPRASEKKETNAMAAYNFDEYGGNPRCPDSQWHLLANQPGGHTGT